MKLTEEQKRLKLEKEERAKFVNNLTSVDRKALDNLYNSPDELNKLIQDNLDRQDALNEITAQELKAQAAGGDKEAQDLVAWEKSINDPIKVEKQYQEILKKEGLEQYGGKLDRLPTKKEFRDQIKNAVIFKKDEPTVGTKDNQNIAIEDIENTIKTRNKNKMHMTINDLKGAEILEEYNILKTEFDNVKGARSFVNKMIRKFQGIEDRLSKAETQKVFNKLSQSKSNNTIEL